MLRTRSPSARAAEDAERQVRLQRRQQRHQQQQQQQQQANKPATPPTPRNELGANCLSTESYGKINSNISSSSANISNNRSNHAIVVSAATPGSARGSRLSLGPVPNERFSIESRFPSLSSNSLSPPPPDDRSRSRHPPPPSPHHRQGETASAGFGSSSCLVVDLEGIDTETKEDTEKGLLSSSAVSIEVACQLDGASLPLPPQGELFGPDSPDQKRRQQQKQQKQQQQKQQQQQQQHDLAPVPFIRGSSGSSPDAAVLDFDVDEIDGLIGELVEEQEDQVGEHCLVDKLCGQPKQLQEKEQQLQQQDHHRHYHPLDTQKGEGGGGQEEHGGDHQQQQKQQPQQQKQQSQQEDKRKDEERGKASATTAPAPPATFMGPGEAILVAPVIQHAIGNAVAIASRMSYMTQEANTHASAVAAQSQVEVGLAWQTVVSAVHAVAVSLKANNETLVASNVELEAEKRGFVRRISSLENNVKVLIAQRDRLTARLHESGAGLPAETSDNVNDNNNRNGDDGGFMVYNCTSPAGGMGMSPATPVSATTLCKRATEVAAATAAAIAAFDNSATKPTVASGTGTATGQPGSTMTTAAVPAVMNAIAETTTTTTMAPQQCEVGMPTQTILPSVTPSTLTTLSTTTSISAPSISISIAKPAPSTTTNEKPKSVSSTAAAAAAPATSAAAPTTAPTTAAAAAPAVPTTTAINAPATAATAAPTVSATTVSNAPTAAAAAAPTATPAEPTAAAPIAPTATPASVRPKMIAGTPKRRSGKKTPGSTTRGYTPWVGGGAGGGVFGSPPAVENRVEVMATPASLAARLENEMRQEDAKRTPLRSAPINTVLRSVPSTAGKGRKASPCVSIPTLGQAYLTTTRGIENEQAGTRLTATVAVKRIISDDRGATDGNRPKPEGMYGRLRSASRPRKSDSKVVAGGGRKVVAGAGVSSGSRQETVTNKGAAGGRSKVVPKQRWR